MTRFAFPRTSSSRRPRGYAPWLGIAAVVTLVAALGGQPAVGATTSTATDGLIVKAELGQQVHDDATGHRPPAGPQVAAYPADDAADVVARPARALGTQTAPGLDDSLATGHDRHTIAPGVSLSTDRSYDAAGFVNSWVLTTDLAGPTRPALLSEAVSNARRPSELADAAGAVAATNGDFFAINTTNAPIGPVVRDGVSSRRMLPQARRSGLPPPGSGRSQSCSSRARSASAGRADRLRA